MTQEYALAFDQARERRFLIVPALFDEGNKLRRFTVEVMRRLDRQGIDSMLPDLPGCNESLQSLAQQNVETWREAVHAAASHFGATHALAIRGGCLLTPNDLPTWHYAPVKAAAILRQMLRARVLSSREAGREESREALEQEARQNGIELIGYPLGAAFYRAFETMVPAPGVCTIGQEEVGGPGLWLRAEPDDNAEQADALAALIAAKVIA